MNYKERKLVHILHYLMSHCSEAVCDKVHLLKLIWMADRYHLRKFGSMMTGLDYCAYPNGPVNRSVYELLKKSDTSDDKELEQVFFSVPPSIDTEHTHYRPNGAIEYACLSDASKESLDIAIRTMAELSANKVGLSEYSHRFPEWRRVCDGIDAENGVFPAIDIADFFDSTEDPRDEFCADIPKELVDLNRELVVEG